LIHCLKRRHARLSLVAIDAENHDTASPGTFSQKEASTLLGEFEKEGISDDLGADCAQISAGKKSNRNRTAP
jgi:hypothetical protein